MFKSSQFDKTLETATSHLKLEPDWASIIVICDLIRQNDVTPKHAITQIKKKMVSQNPHTAMYSLMVLESVVKNCGSPVHEELFANKANCEAFAQLVQTTPHENVRNKMLELIQVWSHAFRSAYKYRGIKDTMNILKTEGYKFPEMKEVSEKLFASDVAPEWADGDCCHRCRTSFSIVNRKHHCRNCGQVFCGQCSSKTSILPKFGIEKEVRVCDGCFDMLQKPSSAVSAKKEEEDLPAEYLASSLSQQNQQPVRKSDEELREEEELQLALALSQSEAESKKQQSFRRATATTYPKASSPPPPLNLQDSQRSPSPEPETPSDPELARYLNRSYWEQRQVQETTSPSAPSPMPSSISLNVQKTSSEKDAEIDEFTQTMRTQVEIFVNRMKSNSSRGRSIANDTSVQTLFMNITSMHSRLLTYIKEMDDKRLWYEQLQDKMSQIKDSRAALDVLRQEHIEKMRRIAEEQERQRQMQMAYKLEIMRKKKQEYLQYQRQLALQRIQEQEREMQMRQEQQKAQYMMGGTNAFPNVPNAAFMSPPGSQGSPMHQQQQQQFTGQFPGNYANPQAIYGQVPMNNQGGAPGFPLQQQQPSSQSQQQSSVVPNPQSAFMPINPAQNTMQIHQPGMIPTTGMDHQQIPNSQQPNMMMPPGSQLPPNHTQQQLPPMMQIPPIMSTTVAPSVNHMQNPNYQTPQLNQSIPPQNYQPAPQQSQHPQAPVQPPAPVQAAAPAEPEKPKEVEVAELISFD
ncbi:hypothetical protein PVAND_005103 [Polypedilum vanderplanki]|uniref:Hepatocyte growth factor-regulated tyrosine kinase substrate n=1 Tax=Polypedilum vanderplanki TaxID=319348 RepID=A0A9J6BZK5_POLVA|nr:hypothetical protein PVAND_005103 [Polypedilum vanderplanki]